MCWQYSQGCNSVVGDAMDNVATLGHCQECLTSNIWRCSMTITLAGGKPSFRPQPIQLVGRQPDCVALRGVQQTHLPVPSDPNARVLTIPSDLVSTGRYRQLRGISRTFRQRAADTEGIEANRASDSAVLRLHRPIPPCMAIPVPRRHDLPRRRPAFL